MRGIHVTKFKFIFLVAFITAQSMAASAPTLDQIVAAHYPAELIRGAAAMGDPDNTRQQAYVQLTIDTREYVVAAYSTGGSMGTGLGALVLLEHADGAYRVDDAVTRSIGGDDPALRAIDLDADGRPEVIVTFDQGKGGVETWIYRVANGRLVGIGPLNPQHGSLLLVPEILDLDGKGSMDLVQDLNYGSKRDPKITHAHFALRNGVYVALEPLDYYSTFSRGNGKPVSSTETFTVPANVLGKPFRLTVSNGMEFGRSARVASGSITVNGVVVSGPSDFSESRAVWSVPIMLSEQNAISVTLGGKPGGCIAVAIRHD